MNNSLVDINPEELEQKVMIYFKTIHKCTKTFKVSLIVILWLLFFNLILLGHERVSGGSY